MLTTRQELFVDWTYSGAHANEMADDVGRGLLRGYIYFRYAYDMIASGETIEREVSHVHLSDGSVYELGTGMSSEKIDILYEGQSVDGSVTLSVNGKLGVGVSSITRSVTISYDDGKVPVLDVEQLDTILEDLKESLTDSMVSTANEVKKELLDKVDSVSIDLEASCNTKIEAAKSSLQSPIDELTKSLQALVARVNSRVNVSRWALKQGQAVAGNGMSNGGYLNLIESGPKAMFGSRDVFLFNEERGGITIPSEMFQFPKLLTIGFSLTLDLPEGFDSPVSMLLIGAKDESVYARSVMHLNRNYVGGRASNVQFSLQSYIGTGGTGHPVVDGGFKLVVHNGGSDTITIVEGSSVHLTLN